MPVDVEDEGEVFHFNDSLTVGAGAVAATTLTPLSALLTDWIIADFELV
jgi:hypothetical protein